jgi:hypothetical protein
MLLTKILPIKTLVGLLTVFFLWQAFIWLRPKPEPLSPEQTAAFRVLTRDLVADLPLIEGGPHALGIARLANDPKGEVTDLLRQAAATRPDWNPIEENLIKKFLSDVTQAVSNASSLDEILYAGREVDLRLVLSGRIESRPTAETPARLSLTLYDTREGRFLHRDTHERIWTREELQTLAATHSSLDTRHSSLNKSLRTSWWLLVILLPWITYPAFERILRRHSNLWNAAWLLGLTLLALLSGAWIHGTDFTTGPGWTANLTSVAVAAYYLFTLNALAKE